MKITLYQCTCRVNDVNKIKNSRKVAEVEAEVYGNFFYSQASFKLSKKWKSNYCTFYDETFDMTFCGWTTVSTNAKGLYTYSIKEDILEMAWLDGSFNTNAVTVYSHLGSNLIPDGRIMREPETRMLEYTIEDRYYAENWQVAMIVQDTGRDTELEWDQRHQSGEYYPRGIPGKSVYLLSPMQFSRFYKGLRFLDSDTQALVGPSIIGIYFYPKFWSDHLIWTTLEEDHIVLPLFSRNEEQDDPGAKVEFRGEHGTKTTETFYRVRGIARTLEQNLSDERFVSTNLNLRGDIMDGQVTMNINNGPTLSLPISTLVSHEGETEITAINKIGYRVSLNLIGNTATFYPTVNGNTKYNMGSQMQLQNLIQVAFDTSFQTANDRISAGINVIGSVASVVGSLALMATGIGGIGGAFAAASAAASGVTQSTNAISSAIGGVMSADQGSSTIAGGLGQHYSLPAWLPTKVFVAYLPYVEYTNFVNIYGKPDGHIRNISTLTGYVQTSGARLTSPSGVFTIGARAVDEMVNGSGVFILPNP